LRAISRLAGVGCQGREGESVRRRLWNRTQCGEAPSVWRLPIDFRPIPRSCL